MKTPILFLLFFWSNGFLLNAQNLTLETIYDEDNVTHFLLLEDGITIDTIAGYMGKVKHIDYSYNKDTLNILFSHAWMVLFYQCHKNKNKWELDFWKILCHCPPQGLYDPKRKCASGFKFKDHDKIIYKYGDRINEISINEILTSERLRKIKKQPGSISTNPKASLFIKQFQKVTTAFDKETNSYSLILNDGYVLDTMLLLPYSSHVKVLDYFFDGQRSINFIITKNGNTWYHEAKKVNSKWEIKLSYLLQLFITEAVHNPKRKYPTNYLFDIDNTKISYLYGKEVKEILIKEIQEKARRGKPKKTTSNTIFADHLKSKIRPIDE
jgi:hypothetical protein